jgi:hypothetical protein
MADILVDVRLSDYWLRVSDVTRLGEFERSGEDMGLPRRCDDFAILWAGIRDFVALRTRKTLAR